VGEQTERLMDGYIDRWMDGWIDKKKNRHTGRQMEDR
jgi:hypothetical protein